MDEPRHVRQVVAAHVRAEFQDADAGGPWAEGLPAGRVGGIPVVHHVAAAESAVEDAVLPGRGTLGAEAAEFAALVQDSGRVGGPVDREKVRSQKSEVRSAIKNEAAEFAALVQDGERVGGPVDRKKVRSKNSEVRSAIKNE